MTARSVIARQIDGHYRVIEPEDIGADLEPVAAFPGQLDILLDVDGFLDLRPVASITEADSPVTMVCAYTDRDGLDTSATTIKAGEDLRAFALAAFRRRAVALDETVNFVCLVRGVLPGRVHDLSTIPTRLQAGD